MFDSTQYQLLDFGDGRRLERFGPVVLDRPARRPKSIRPVAPRLWSSADARFERIEAEQGQWTLRGDPPQRWTIAHGRMTLELKRTDFGHVGLFPEQAENWDWIAEQVRRSPPDAASPHEGPQLVRLHRRQHACRCGRRRSGDARRCGTQYRCLGADATPNFPALDDAPIRWIAEDAVKFVKREIRRGNRYDAVILDPPSYGHGAHGEVWRLAEDLPRLLALCAELTAATAAIRAADMPHAGPFATPIAGIVATVFGSRSMSMPRRWRCSVCGQTLPSGIVARWTDESVRPIEPQLFSHYLKQLPPPGSEESDFLLSLGSDFLLV